MRLLIVTNVVHYSSGGRLHAYAPYAREIEIWADLFPQVILAAPCKNAAAPGDCAPLHRGNISIAPQKEVGGETWKAKAALAVSIPVLIWQLSLSMTKADAIHVRCPGNLGLLALLLSPLFTRYRVAKFAGQWGRHPAENWTVRLQRAILRSRWWKSPVTVYGEWPGQPSHVIPFFTSVLTADQIARARKAAGRGKTGDPLRVLFVGRLSRAKNVDVLLEALAQLRLEGLQCRCSIVGHGPERRRLEDLTRSLGLADFVEFAGGMEFARVLEYFERSDVLVLASETEGWPKAIAEAMAFGVICIGSNLGLIPQMLGSGRGLLVQPRNRSALCNALRQIVLDPQRFEPMRAQAAAWAQQYSLESLRETLRSLLEKQWAVCLARPQPACILDTVNANE